METICLQCEKRKGKPEFGGKFCGTPCAVLFAKVETQMHEWCEKCKRWFNTSFENECRDCHDMNGKVRDE